MLNEERTACSFRLFTTTGRVREENDETYIKKRNTQKDYTFNLKQTSVKIKKKRAWREIYRI